MKLSYLAGLGFVLAWSVAKVQSQEREADNWLLIELTRGRIVIRMLPEAAPRHVACVRELVHERFHDRLSFHREIPGFVAQSVDPTGTGCDGAGEEKMAAECSATAFERSTDGIAWTADFDSADSQVFICAAAAAHGNGQYTVSGQVVEGMGLVDALPAGNLPADAGRMLAVRLLADLDERRDRFGCSHHWHCRLHRCSCRSGSAEAGRAGDRR